MKTALACLVLALAPWLPASLAQSTTTPTDVDALAARLDTAADEYLRVFRGLTAEETKVIEVLDDRGRVDKRREIVSDLLVYQTARGKEVTEYRDVISVDGQARERRGERALALLTRAAREDTIRKELEAIDKETSRYEFRRHLRGFTVTTFRLPKDWRSTHDVVVEGREPVDGHDTVVLRYRERVTAPGRRGRPLPLPGEFKDPPRLWQGRVWFDETTGQVRRVTRELAAKHPDVAEPLVLVHGESHYTASRFGILVPDRLVFEWRQQFSHPKGAPPSFGLSERTTFTYGEFRRFEVATSESIAGPSEGGPHEH